MNIVFLEFSIEGAQADVKRFGAAFLVESADLHGLLDHDALDIRHGRAGGDTDVADGGGGRLAQVFRDVGDIEGLVSSGHDHHTFEDVFEFANISGPVVPGENIHGVARDARWRAAIFLRSFSDEMRDEEGDVFLALTQRRNLNGDDFEAIEEVVAKGSLVDHFFQGAIRRGDEPDIDRERARVAEPFKLLVFEYAEEFGLQGEGQFADFVKEEGSFVRDLEAAFTRSSGAGKCTGDMAEEFTFDQRFRDARAIEFDEGRVFARAVVVDGLRNEVFTGAGFAVDEYSGFRRGNLANGVVDLGHVSRLADNVREAVAFIEPSFEFVLLEDEALLAESVLNDGFKFRDVDGLGLEVEGPLAQRFDSKFHFRVFRDDDDANVRASIFGDGHEAHAVDPVRVELGDHGVEGPVIESVVGLFPVVDPFHFILARFQVGHDFACDSRIALDDQYDGLWCFNNHSLLPRNIIGYQGGRLASNRPAIG